jgi:hypothetical protein
VSMGDSRDRRALDMDAEGSARIDGLPVSAGTSYRVSTTKGPASYATAPFALSDKVGKRVVLHAYEATPALEGAMVGMQAFVFVSLREDSLSMEHLFNVYNIGKVSWVPSPGVARVGLPEGFKAFNKPDSMGDVRFDEDSGKGAYLVGTIAPGPHESTFRYQVPLAGEEKQTLRIELPPRVGEVRVFAEASKKMGLAVAGFPEAQRTQGRDGRKLLVTARQATAGERGINVLEITVAGLPTKGPGRWIAVLLAGLAVAVGGTYVARQRGEGGMPEEARDDLLEAREALLGEFVALEKARKSGDIGPKTYARLSLSLLDALARIESRLEEMRTQQAAKRLNTGKKRHLAELAAIKSADTGDKNKTSDDDDDDRDEDKAKAKVKAKATDDEDDDRDERSKEGAS